MVRQVALAADQAIVVGTPVDTGRARANWIAQIGSASDAVLPEPASPLGATQASLDNAENIIRGYLAGSSIHLTNNLPYIQRLNDGYSRQAPANFVENAILLAVRVVTESRLVPDQPGG